MLLRLALHLQFSRFHLPRAGTVGALPLAQPQKQLYAVNV